MSSLPSNTVDIVLDEDSFSRVKLRPSDDAPDEATGGYRGQILNEKYLLVELLGAGSAGEVYKAVPLADGPPVAVKIMRARAAAIPDQLRRFRREARAGSLLKHPNTIRVLELGEDPDRGVFFIVMELLLGESLAHWIHRQAAPPPLAQVRALMLPLLDAFEAAHAAGIVHRDLKPENVFLGRSEGGERIVKVLDFGLAHVVDPDDTGGTLTRPETVAGTPQYMSPEQCRSLQVGPSTDLYAMGCLLTDLLQLRPPFDADSLMEVLARQMFLPPPPLDRAANAEPVPDELEALRLALLAKTPEERPANVAAVRALFEQALPASAKVTPPLSLPPPEPVEDGKDPASSQSLSNRVKRFFWRGS